MATVFALPLLGAERKAIFVQDIEAISQPTLTIYLDHNCYPLGGCPRLERSVYDFGKTFIIGYDAFAAEVSATDKVPAWVAEYLTPAQLQGRFKTRLDNFRADPLLPAGERVEKDDYHCQQTGYARGHQAADANQTADRQLKDETYVMSNMAPQIPAFNSGVWSRLEAKTREWALARRGAYVVTGALFYDPKEDDPATATGTVGFEQIPPKQIAVATHFYKIIVARNPVTKKDEAIAFVVKNEKPAKPYDLSDFITSIDWIEEHTAINFMPQLSPAEEARLERAPAKMWK
jgi:endonuclease G